MKKNREALCRYLESVGRSDRRSEGFKLQALPYLAVGSTVVLATGVTMGLLPEQQVVQTFAPWLLGIGAVLALGAGGFYLAGSVGDVIDRRYQSLLHMVRDDSFATVGEFDLHLNLRRRPSQDVDRWGRLSGSWTDKSHFTLDLSTRYWTETDTMEEEYTEREDDGNLRTGIRTVVVHRREYEQDIVRLVVEKDSAWAADKLKRHLSPHGSQTLNVSEVQARPGRLEAEFVTGVARTVSGPGMPVEEIDHDRLLLTPSLLEVFQWLEQGEAQAQGIPGQC